MKDKIEERMVLNLIWQGLYDCQDEDSVKRGTRYRDFFVVWRAGKAYQVRVTEDEYEMYHCQDENKLKEEEE